MTWLSEDPWPLFGAGVIAALVFLGMLWNTGRGKYLGVAAGALGIAGLFVLLEWLWVTDRERIEAVIYDIAGAVEAGDFDRIEGHLAPEFDEEIGTINKLMMRGAVAGLRFEFVKINKLRAQAGSRTGMGTADFYGMAQWQEPASIGRPDLNMTPPPGVGFSVGFREVAPDDWQVTRIDVVEAPMGIAPDSVAGYLSRFGRR